MNMPKYIAVSIESALSDLEANYKLHLADIKEITVQVLDSIMVEGISHCMPYQSVDISRFPILSGSSDSFKDSEFQQKIHLAYRVYREDLRTLLLEQGIDDSSMVDEGFSYGYYLLDVPSSKLILQHFEF